MKRDRDTWLAIGLGLILLLITITSVIQQTQKKAPIPYTSFSTYPHGTLALFLWLEELEYSVSNAIPSLFSVLDEASTALILEPSIGITEQEWEAIDSWINDGGTLLLAGNGLGMRFASRHYDFRIGIPQDRDLQISPQVPFLTSPPIEKSITIPNAAYLITNRADYVVLLADGSLPVIVTFTLGQGKVILSATAYPFSNAGLKEPGNPAIALNLVTAAQKTGKIWFDEWHHGFRGGEGSPSGLKEWLLETPPGNALIYAVFVIFVALFLQGRHFGKPVPLPKRTPRPAPIEYVTAIANLNRRAGHQTATLQQYHQWLKRTLGSRYRINPLLPDEVYLEQLSKQMPPSSIQNLRSLFTRLLQTNLSEPEFVRLAAEVSGWTNAIHVGEIKQK